MRRCLFVVEKFKRQMKSFMFNITPRIYNLPDAVYGRWMSFEWIWPKY